MKKQKFLKGRKLVALALVAAMSVTCAEGYRGGVLDVKAAAKAADSAVQVAGASTGIMGKEVMNLDFESPYTDAATTYVEDSKNFSLTNGATVTEDPDNSGNKVLQTTSNGYLRANEFILTDADFSKGVAVSVKVRPEIKTEVKNPTNDWNMVFSLGSNNTGGMWVGIDGSIGFIPRSVRDGWGNNYFPGGNWVAGNTVNDNFNYLITSPGAEQWHTLTYVYSLNMIYIFCDGVLATKWKVTHADMENVLKEMAKFSSFSLGCGIDPAWNAYCEGYYDDVKVYELSTHNITLPDGGSKYTCTGNDSGILHGSDVTFKVAPKPGYRISAVKADGVALTGTDGNYTISEVTSDKTVTVEAEAIEYTINTKTDGAADTAFKFTVEASAYKNGEVELPALTTGQIGWFLDEDERDTSKAKTKLEFDPSNYEPATGITLYRYNPHAVTDAAGARDGLTGGTFAELEDKLYAPGDVVEIKVTPPAGKAPKITAKDAANNAIETTVVSTADGGQAVRFTMPSTAVTITKYEFTELDFTALETELTTDQAIYDTENTPTASGIQTKYTEETWNAFKEAFDAAKAVKDKGATENTQAAIDESLAALKKAKGDLVYAYKVTLNKNTATVEKGATETLTTTIVTDDPSGASSEVTWSSSNTEVATVNSSGVVAAVAAGTTTITATMPDGTKAECEVKVIVSPASITLADKEMVLGSKQRAAFAMGAVIAPDDVTETAVTWSSSDETVAEVDAQGNITAKAVGTATITATTVNDISTTGTVTVINGIDSKAAYNADETPAMEITDDGVYLTFRSKTIEGGTDAYQAPAVLLNNGDFVYLIRSCIDMLGPNGWVGTTNLGQGYDGALFLAENKEGVDCYVSAVKVGDNIRVRMTIGSVASETYVPIVGDGPCTLILTGDHSEATELQAVDKYHFNDPGPVIPVVPVYPGSVVTPKPAVTPGPEITVPIAVENIKVEESLKGTEWWNGTQKGADYSLSGKDTSMVMYVGASELVGDYGAFSIELQSSDGKYFTTNTNWDAWTAGDGVTGVVSGEKLTPTGNPEANLVAGHVYRITVTRKGNDITVNYYDATDQKEFFEVSATGINFPDDVNVHVIAQVGTFDIGQEVNVDGNTPTTGPDVTAGPDITAGPDVTAAPSAEPSKEPDATVAPSTAPSAEPSTEPSAEPDDNKGAETGSKVTVSGSTYKVNSGSQVTYTAKKKASKNVTVPATVKIKGKTYKVTSIAANAFKGNSKIQKVTLSKNITKIGKNAFSNCKKLKTIVIKSKKLKASGIAKNAFKGVTKKTVIKVPKAKKKAYQKLFRKKGLSKNVKVKAI